MSLQMYGNFDPSKFEAGSTPFDAKIARGQKLDKQEMLALGMSASQFEYNSVKSYFTSLTSYFSTEKRETYLLNLAERYISVKQKAHVIELKKALEGLGLDESKINSLIGELDLSTDRSLRHSLVSRILLNVDSSKVPLDKAGKIEKIFKEFLGEPAFEEINRARSPEAKREKIEALLGLHVLPHPGLYFYQEFNQEKKELLSQHLNPSTGALIAEQAGKYPIMQAAVAALRDNFADWDDFRWRFDDAGLEHLGTAILQQIKNLKTLSMILSELSQVEENSRALAAYSPAQLELGELKDDAFSSLMVKFMEGTADMSTRLSKGVVKEILKQNIDFIKKEMPQPQPTKELEELRKRSPITSRVIQLQSELHQAMRHGKAWATLQPTLQKQGTSCNDVFKLQNPDGTSGPAAFFKVGAGGENAAGTMEKLMWNIALVMGLEEQFVPTGVTEVRDGSQRKGGTEKAMQWDEKGQLQDLREAQAPLRGGIQVAQKGKSYWEHVDGGGTFDRSQLAGGIVASLVFGMFDAHGNNIFVTDDGKIKFFDNTRSLPNSNGFINRGDFIVSAYRCALLLHPEAKMPLSSDEIEKLKQDVQEYKQKFEDLKTYLNSDEVQSQLKQLPPGWMDLEASLSAMEQRMDHMEAALNSGTVKTLEDLAAQSNPGYKLSYAITYLGMIKESAGTMFSFPSLHNEVGYFHVLETLDTMGRIGIDMAKVKGWCDDPNLSLDEITQRIVQHYQEIQANPPQGNDLDLRGLEVEKLSAEIKAGAAEDYKDWERASCEFYTEERNIDEFGAQTISSFDFASKGDLSTPGDFEAALCYLVENPGVPSMLGGKPGDRRIFIITPTSFQAISIDMGSKFGMIREKTVDKNGKMVLGPEIAIKDFLAALSQSSPPKIQELFVLPNDAIDFFMLNSPTGIMLTKSPAGDLIVNISVQDTSGNKGVQPYGFIPDPDAEGQFLVLPEHNLGVEGSYTIEDIAHFCKSLVGTIVP